MLEHLCWNWGGVESRPLHSIQNHVRFVASRLNLAQRSALGIRFNLAQRSALGIRFNVARRSAVGCNSGPPTRSGGLVRVKYLAGALLTYAQTSNSGIHRFARCQSTNPLILQKRTLFAERHH